MQLARVRTRPEIASAVRDALTGVRIAELPVTLRFWDGSVLDGGAPVVEVRDPVAIAHILHAPGQMGLARAWVAGALDVEDVADLEAILRLRSFKVELTPRDIARLFAAAVRIVGPGDPARSRPCRRSRRPGTRRGLHSLARDKAAIRHHYDVSNAFYALILGPTMVYSCAYFAEPGESLEAAQDAQARPDLPQAAAGAGRAAARHRLRLGLAADPRGAALRRARRRRDALGRAGRARPRARRRRWA